MSVVLHYIYLLTANYINQLQTYLWAQCRCSICEYIIIMLLIMQFVLYIMYRLTNKHGENTERLHRLHNSRAAIIGLISRRHLPIALYKSPI